MIGLLHGVNPVPRLAVPVTRSGELRVGVENWVTVAGLSLVLPQAPEGAIVVVKNCTTSALVVSASSQITGVSQSGAAIPATNRVRILPGQVGSFLRGDRGWFAQGCEPPALAFAYNGTPLANNLSNPGGASDLIHFLGGVGSYANPATNGTITAVVSSAFSGSGGASVLTDRVASPTSLALNWQANNQVNSWAAWQFPADFAPTGLLIQARGDSNTQQLRSFRIHYSSDLSTALTSSSPVSTWIQGPGWTDQAQITGQGSWHFFPFSGANTNPVAQLPKLRRLAIFVTGLSSSGENYPTFADVNWFGDWFGV